MMHRHTFDGWLIPTGEKVEFIKNLAMMLKSGVTVSESLQMLAGDTESPAFKRALFRIAHDTEQGLSLSDAFHKEESVFGRVSVNMVRVGEMSGSLDETLFFLSEYLERGYDLEQEVKGALFYPKFIITVTGIIGIFLVSTILPKLVPVFKQLHVTLPLMTRMLLGISVIAKKYWIEMVMSIVGVIVLYIATRNIPKVRSVIDYLKITIPVSSGITRTYQLALFSQLFAVLLKSGTPINEALGVTAEAAINVHYREALLRIRGRVEKGESLSSAIRTESGLFPHKVAIVVGAGEQSGSLGHALESLSEYYAKEVKIKTKKLPVLIEPALLIFIAFVVGFIGLAIIMPIYQVTQGVTR